MIVAKRRDELVTGHRAPLVLYGMSRDIDNIRLGVEFRVTLPSTHATWQGELPMGILDQLTGEILMIVLQCVMVKELN